MDFTSKPSFSLLFHALLLLFFYFSSFLQFANPISDCTNLLYKNCADQTFSTSHSQALSTLFHELVSHSFQYKFFKTVEGDDETSILGLFQCRRDISDEECRNCVSTLPHVSSSLCGDSMAARVQLYGCYMRYEPERVSNMLSNKHDLVYKTCGGSKQVVASGFEEMRHGAFAALESEIANGGDHGFYETEFESMEVTAQCEGDLEGCECEECVSSAVQIAEEECGGDAFAEIYLNKCFLSYSYNYHPEENGRSENNNNNNGKTVAIVLGGAAALCFGLIIVLFIKSWTKKEED